MKQQQQSVLLAGMLALALGVSACAQWRGGTDSSGSGSSSGSSGTTSDGGAGIGAASSGGWNSAGSSGSSGSSGSAGSSGNAGYDQSGAAVPSASPNATVAAIEPVQRQGATGTEGDGAAMGSSGSAGATGSSPSQSYRITLRMDDGSTQVVTQDATPDFRSGDRVSLSGGTIQR